MRKIIATIFCFASPLLLTGGAPELLGEADPGVPGRLHDEAEALVLLFRSPWRRSHTKLSIVFSPAVPENSAELGRANGEWVLMLNGSPGRWNENFALRHKLWSALLLAAANAPLAPGECRALPPWVVSAATRRLAAQKGEERLIVGNSRAPVLRALLGRRALVPERIVREADPARFTPATLAWEEELAAALFLSGGKKIGSGNYLRICGANALGKFPPTDADSFWMPHDPEVAEARFAGHARRMAWHELCPRPAKLSLEKLEEIRKFSLPVLDGEGKAVPGKFEECDVLELAEKLRGRPDAIRHASEARRRFRDLHSGESRRVQAAGAIVADLAGNSHAPGLFHTSKLRRALDELYAELRRCERLDAYMLEADFRRAPVRRIFRRRLNSIDFLVRNSSLLPCSRRERLTQVLRERGIDVLP